MRKLERVEIEGMPFVEMRYLATKLDEAIDVINKQGEEIERLKGHETGARRGRHLQQQSGGS